jgi:hypothetical protein
VHQSIETVRHIRDNDVWRQTLHTSLKIIKTMALILDRFVVRSTKCTADLEHAKCCRYNPSNNMQLEYEPDAVSIERTTASVKHGRIEHCCCWRKVFETSDVIGHRQDFAPLVLRGDCPSTLH